jgi:hypothetical protein
VNAGGVGTWFFASDVHGSEDRYRKLFQAMRAERPRAVLLGGDLLPYGRSAVGVSDSSPRNFIADFLAPCLAGLKDDLEEAGTRARMSF